MEKVKKVYYLKGKGDFYYFMTFVKEENGRKDFVPDSTSVKSKENEKENEYHLYLSYFQEGGGKTLEKFRAEGKEVRDLTEVLPYLKEFAKNLTRDSINDFDEDSLIAHQICDSLDKDYLIAYEKEISDLLLFKEKEREGRLSEEERRKMELLEKEVKKVFTSPQRLCAFVEFWSEYDDSGEKTSTLFLFWRGRDGRCRWREQSFFESERGWNLLEQHTLKKVAQEGVRIKKLVKAEELFGESYPFSNFESYQFYKFFFDNFENKKTLLETLRLLLKEKEEGLSKEEEKTKEELKAKLNGLVNSFLEKERKKEERQRKEKLEKIRILLKILPSSVVLKEIENQYGEVIPEKELLLSEEKAKVDYVFVNCYSSSDLGLGTCRCFSHDPLDSFELLPEEAIDSIKENLERVVSILRRREGDEYFERLKEVKEEELLTSAYPEFSRKALSLRESLLKEYQRQLEKEEKLERFLKENGFPLSFITKEITNQYGEELVASEYYFSEGKLYHYYVNCYSSSDLGLGTCRCSSHDPTTVKETTLKRYLQELEKGDFLKFLSQEEKEELKENLLKSKTVSFEEEGITEKDALKVKNAILEKLGVEVKREKEKEVEREPEP